MKKIQLEHTYIAREITRNNMSLKKGAIATTEVALPSQYLDLNSPKVIERIIQLYK